MLNINTAATQNNNKSRVSFGTNLIVGRGVVEHLNKNPQELQKIQEFKEYLATDGKNWNAELTYDTFSPTEPSNKGDAENFIRKSANGYDYESRKAASKLISQMKSEDAAALIKKLSTDKDTEVQAMAACQLGEIKDKKIATALAEELLQLPNSRVKEEVIYSFESIQDKTLKNKLIEKYINSDDATIKRSTVELAYKTPDINAFDKDLEKFSKDSDPKIRQAIFYKLMDLSAEEYDKNSNMYDSMVKAGLNDSDSQVKEVAGGVIGRIKDPNEASKLINELLENSTESWSRRYIASSAAFIKDPKVAVPLIEKLLTHHDSNVKDGAAQAAMRSENPEIRNKFIEQLLNGPNTSIRAEVAWGIGKIKDPAQQAAVFEKLLKDSDPSTKENTAWQITSIEDASVRDALINKYLTSNDFDIKKGIIRSLYYLDKKDPEKAKEFAQILSKDPDKSIQKDANEVLDRIKVYEQKDGYRIKITDGDKVVGNKKVKEDSNIFNSFFNAYKAIFQNPS